jgi:hypothetical protein
VAKSKPPGFGAPPPPPSKPGGGIGGKLDAMLKQLAPAWVKYEPALLKWSAVYKMDPLQLAAVLAGIENTSADPTARSSAGAVGLAQIKDKSVNPNLNPNAIWDGPGVLTDAWKENPNNAIKYAAWRLSYAVSSNAGDINAAYQTYNPGYTGKQPASLLPKGYTPTSGSGTQPTPVETAGTKVAGAAAVKGLATSQWAVFRNGKVKFVTTRDRYDSATGQALSSAPKDTLKVFGQPLSSSAFLQQYASISDDYLAYTNKRPSFAQAAQVIKSRHVAVPVAAASRAGARLHRVAGVEAERARLHGGLASGLRCRTRAGQRGGQERGREQCRLVGVRGRAPAAADYSNSSEYKSSYAANANVFAQIYGQPQDADHATIDGAVKNGYDANQFATYLRQQPQWKSVRRRSRCTTGSRTSSA